MNTRISDLFDMYDGELPPLNETAPLDARAVGEITAEKIHSCGGAEKKRPGRRLLRTALIAAAVVVLLAAAAFAKVPSVITDQREAVAAANAELDKLRGLGVINADFTIEYGKCTAKLENDGRLFSVFSRKLDPFYLIGYNAGKYYGNIEIDNITGRILSFNITAKADEGRKPLFSVSNGNGGTWDFYDNFGDIFDPSLTLNGVCQKLCDYWGFSGFTLVCASAGNSPDAEDYPADGNWLLSDHGTGQTRRTTVKFYGDQAGEVQYIEVSCFADGASILAGFAHSQG